MEISLMSFATKTLVECVCKRNQGFSLTSEGKCSPVPGPSSGDRLSWALAWCAGGASAVLALSLVAVAVAPAEALLWMPGLFLSHMFTVLLL